MNTDCCKGCEKPAGRSSLSSCQILFGLAVRHAPIGIVAVKSGKVLNANPASCEMLGLQSSEALGSAILDHIVPENRDETMALVDRIRQKGLSAVEEEFFEITAKKKDGSEICLRIRLARLETQCCGLITLCYITDVTERKKLQAQLRDQAITDPLTDLFNRRYMEETFHREMARARRQGTNLGVMMLDLDHFKRFNDTHGHTGGDELLRAFAQLLKNDVREEDVVCRYGGEEFVIIMPGADIEIVKTRAELIRQETAELKIYFQKNMLGSTTVSIGIAFFPDHGGRPEKIITAADDALYRAKEEGRNRVVVAES